MFNAKKPPPHHHDMQKKIILAFRRIVHFFHTLAGFWYRRVVERSSAFKEQRSALN